MPIDADDPAWDGVDPHVREIALNSLGHMRWHPVDSSNVREISWSPEGLWVQFNRGHVYLYANVGSAFFERMLAIPSRGPTPDTSKGKFLNEYIKPYYAVMGPL